MHVSMTTGRARQKNRQVEFLQNCQHAGEIQHCFEHFRCAHGPNVRNLFRDAGGLNDSSNASKEQERKTLVQLIPSNHRCPLQGDPAEKALPPASRVLPCPLRWIRRESETLSNLQRNTPRGCHSCRCQISVRGFVGQVQSIEELSIHVLDCGPKAPTFLLLRSKTSLLISTNTLSPESHPDSVGSVVPSPTMRATCLGGAVDTGILLRSRLCSPSRDTERESTQVFAILL